MITVSDAPNTYDIGKYYVILPQNKNFDRCKFIRDFNAKSLPEDFSYSSGNNSKWESVESLRNLVRKFVDGNFQSERCAK
jgi:UDP-N-acetylglucosamine 4,6-dehydratase